jgi:glycosyltransferase involved in cell wall biosynthesis
MQSTNEQPLVSIIVPTYNYASYVEKAIQSCLNQTYKPLEIIVVDDGSTDGTAELIARKFDSRVEYIYQDNRGVSAARNAGLEQARGEFVTFLDADDFLTEDAVELRLKPMVNDQELGIVITQNYTQNHNDESPRYRPKYKTDLVSDRLYEMLLSKRLTFATCSALVRSSLAKHFRFPEQISNGEDLAYFAKILFVAKGCLLVQPTAVVRKHSDSQRHDIEKIKKQNMALVETIFDDPFYAGAIEHLRNDFASNRFLSLSRSLYLSGEKALARRYYLEGISAKPANLLKINYLTKFLRSWL